MRERERESVNTKGEVIIGFCWYLHFLVGKQSKDPEGLRCGQEPDVIGPQKSCLESSGRQDPELGKTRQLVLLSTNGAFSLS